MNVLINDALELLSLDTEAKTLETLGALLACWERIQATLPELGSGDVDVFDFLTVFDDTIPSAKRVIAAAGIDPLAVVALSGMLKQRYGSAVPEPVRKMLQPVGMYRHSQSDSDSGLITWKILDPKPATHRKLPAKNMALAVSAEAGLSIELEAGDPLPGVGAEHATYFRFGFNGSCKGGGSVDVPFQYGSAGLSFAANSQVDLNYWYDVPAVAENSPIALFTAQHMTRLPNPFELESLWTGMCQRNSRLAAVKWLTTLDHETAITMRFGGAAAMLANDMADATFEFKASIVKSRTFETLIYVDEGEDGKFLVSHLKAKKEHDQSSVGAVKIGIDLKAVADQVLAFVAPSMRKYSILEKAYGDYLTPGTLLKGKLRGPLEALIADALEGKPELRRLALSLTGDDDQQQVLNDHLIEKMADVFDSGLGLFSRHADDVAAEIVSRINASLPEKYGEPAAQQAEEFLKEVIKIVTQDLAGEIKSLLDGSAKRVEKLTKQLAQFHQDIGERIEKRGSKLDRATVGVTRFLARIDTKIETITKALDKASRARLTIRLWDEQSLRRESSADIVARFLDSDGETRDAFKKITRGDFSAIEGLFAQPPPNVIFMEGDITYTTQRHKGTGIEIGLLDLNVGSQSLFDSKVAVAIDIDGNVIISSTVSASCKRRSVREAQKVSLLSAYDLNVARHTRNMRAKLVVSQDDRNLKLDELEDFLRPFRKVGLLSTLTVSQALNQLKNWRRKSDRKHVKARVDVSLALDNESITRLFETQRSSSDDDIMTLVTGALHDAGVIDHNTIALAANRLKALRNVTGSTNEVFLQIQPSIPKKYGDPRIRALFMAARFGTTQDDTRHFPLAQSGDRKLSQALDIHLYCKGFAVLLDTMRAVYDIHSVSTSGADLVDYLDTQNQLINLCMKRWVRVGQSFLWRPSDEAAEETVAFFLALARTAGLDIRTEGDDSIMSVTLTLNDRDGGAVMVY